MLLIKLSYLGGDDSSTTSTIQEFIPTEVNLGSLKPVTLTINSFFRQEADRLSTEDLFKFLSEARKPGGRLSRLKTFPANFVLQVSGSLKSFIVKLLSGGTGDELLLRLNPDYQKMSPFTSGPDIELTKDIQGFPTPGQYTVNTGYKLFFLLKFIFKLSEIFYTFIRNQ